jgi:hypothetical protein
MSPRFARVAPVLLALSMAVGALGAAAFGAAGCASDDAASGSPPGACDNPADLVARDKGYCPGNRSVSQIAGKCGLDCLLEEDAGGCVSDCVEAQTELSAPCSSCVSGTVLCGRDYCLQECLSDTQSEVCLKCRCGENKEQHSCYDDYERCSGVHLTDCDELAAGAWMGYPELDAGCADDGG